MRDAPPRSNTPLVMGIVLFLLATAAVVYFGWINTTLFAPTSEATSTAEIREKNP